MDIRKKALVVGILLLIALVAASPADWDQRVIYAEAVEVFCHYEVGLWWVDGDMYYERGSRETGFKISLTADDPFPAGAYDVEVDLDLDLARGKGSGEGGAVFVPTDSTSFFGGTWTAKMEEIAAGIWVPVGVRGQSVGVGEYEGWRVKSKSYGIDPAPYAGMCGGADPFGVSMMQLWYYPPH